MIGLTAVLGLLSGRVGGEFPGWTVPARGRLHGDDAQGSTRRVPTGTQSGASELRHGSVWNRRRQYVLQWKYKHTRYKFVYFLGENWQIYEV